MGFAAGLRVAVFDVVSAAVAEVDVVTVVVVVDVGKIFFG